MNNYFIFNPCSNTLVAYGKTMNYQRLLLSNLMSHQGQGNINQDICGIDCNLKLVNIDIDHNYLQNVIYYFVVGGDGLNFN